jgi:hypothetical protein
MRPKTVYWPFKSGMDLRQMYNWLPLETRAGLIGPSMREAAMAPGVNAYLFAHQYGHARRVAASAVLIGTAASMVTGAFWIWLLP